MMRFRSPLRSVSLRKSVVIDSSFARGSCGFTAAGWTAGSIAGIWATVEIGSKSFADPWGIRDKSDVVCNDLGTVWLCSGDSWICSGNAMAIGWFRSGGCSCCCIFSCGVGVTFSNSFGDSVAKAIGEMARLESSVVLRRQKARMPAQQQKWRISRTRPKRG